jgi:CheY-like chemotaxis protein
VGDARQKRILIVDDDRFLTETLRAMIAEHTDAEVKTVADGVQALALLDVDHDFDAVICDISMPGLSGIALYEKLRRSGNPLAGRFIFVTGGAFTESANNFLAAGTVPVLEKPFDSSALGAMLGGILSG